MAADKKPDSQVLPPKDMAAYREIGKAYDERQYKVALKKADGLLKKYPQHADTMSMKGLVLQGMGKKAEALDLAKSALRLNLRSSVCWNILGMVQRAQGNHPEAIKAFRQAWKLDPENFQIGRDLSVLQMHTRDYQGSLDTRQAILAQKQNANFNMLMFGYSHSLAGNSAFASMVIDRYELPGAPSSGGLPPASSFTDDLAAYRLQAVEAGHDAKKALAYANSPAFSGLVVDKLGADEKRARLALAAGKPRDSAALWWSLLGTNPDNLEYAAGLLEAVAKDAGHAIPAPGPLDCDLRAVALARSLQADAAAAGVAVAVVLLAASAHPRCRTLKRLLLDVLPAQHPLFRPCLAAYLRTSLRKGIPSLFSDVRHLGRPGHAAGMAWAARADHYKAHGSTAKGRVLLEVAQEYVAALQQEAGSAALPCYPADAAACLAGLEAGLVAVRTTLPSTSSVKPDVPGLVEAKGDGQGESPDVLPWAALLLARLQDELGDPAAGLATLSIALSHTPTVLDLLTAKARLQKHAGQVQEAADTMEAARQLDTADRHVNNKAVLYMLRAGRIDAAQDTEALFVRHDAGTPDDPLAAMRLLQVSWFDLALGQAYEAAGDLGPALVAYHRCMASMEDFSGDGMDYHAYCLRNHWLRTHHAMLATNQGMGQHPTTLQAAEGLARCYAALARDPAAKVPRERPVKPAAAPTAADGKAKAGGADGSKKEKEGAEAKKESKDGEGEGEGEGGDKKPAFDPWGLAHLCAPNPQELALKYARQLVDGTPTPPAALGWAKPGGCTVAEVAAGAGRVPTKGVDLQEPTTMLGSRPAGWRSGLGLLVRAHVTAGEVALAAGKVGQAAAALALARKEAEADPAGVAPSVVPGLADRLAALQKGVAAAAAAAAAGGAAPAPVAAAAAQAAQ